MKSFLQKHASSVMGVLSGFDRVTFRGTIRQLAHVDGLESYLAVSRVLLKDFGAHAEQVSEGLKQAVTGAVEALGRPVEYLESSAISKEERARQIAQRDGLRDGTICLLTCVEPCKSFDVRRDRTTKRLQLVSRLRKCLYLYRYAFHPTLGFMFTRIQSWFPFNVRVYINGREWLAREMDRQGLGYVRRDNCFTRLSDPEAAQRLMHQQLRVEWPKILDGLLRELHPAYPAAFGRFIAPYYWSVEESEWATDVMFRDAQSLAHLYPRLVRHGITAFSSPDVMRFLGHNVPAHGGVNGHFDGEVTSDFKHRPEGVRIKHRVNGNSVKVYDKQRTVLRFETTIVRPRDFRVYRRPEGSERGPLSWYKLRSGVADLYRRAQVSQASNERYAGALTVVDDSSSLADLLGRLVKPTSLNDRRIRALRPWDPADLQLLRAVNRGEFALNGLRNRDLRALLFPSKPADVKDERRRSARTSRLLRMLRAHNILRKVSRTHRYQVTQLGRRAIAAILAAHDASIDQLARCAA